jgi:Transcriptional regulator, AbiEi antitoxin
VDRSSIDQLLTLAATQHQLFTVQQAAAIGVSPAMVRSASDRGWVRRERQGVYVVAGAGPSRWRPVLAAAMAAGPDAVVSHGTAASIHRFHGVIPNEIELTIPSPGRRYLQDVRVHRSATLLCGDVVQRSGVRVTSPVRTIIDLADRFKEPLLGAIVDEGSIARLWTPEAIGARLDTARRGVAGIAGLRRVVGERTGEGHPDSRLEQRVIRVLKGRFPGYVVHHQVVLEGQVIEIDIAWVEGKIAGEVDGMGTRVVSRTKFERERLRLNVLQRHGWRIVHFTDKMDDRTLVAQIAPLLGL